MKRVYLLSGSKCDQDNALNKRSYLDIRVPKKKLKKLKKNNIKKTSNFLIVILKITIQGTWYFHSAYTLLKYVPTSYTMYSFKYFYTFLFSNGFLTVIVV